MKIETRGWASPSAGLMTKSRISMSSSRGLTVSVATDDEIFAVCAARLRYASPLPAGVARDHASATASPARSKGVADSWIGWPIFYSPLALPVPWRPSWCNEWGSEGAEGRRVVWPRGVPRASVCPRDAADWGVVLRNSAGERRGGGFRLCGDAGATAAARPGAGAGGGSRWM